MSSTLSKLSNAAIRGLMWLIFRRHRPVDGYRPQMQRLDMRQPLAAGVQVEDVAGPVAGRWLRPAAVAGKPQTRQTLLYLHGGAFAFRLPNGHTAMVSRLCAAAGCAAFMPWYRLAPEHPYPAAPDDCLQAYRMLLQGGHAPKDIVVMGDSAGGNLALALLHLIKREGLPMPGGAIALSPVTDLAQISATWRLNKRSDPMYRVQAVVDPARWYCPGGDLLDPVISPYYGSFDGFPPLHFVVGSIEALLEDSVGMVRKAVDQGIRAEVHVWCGMPHVFMLQEHLAETRLARAEVVRWLLALREQQPPLAGAARYAHCVKVFNVNALTGALETDMNHADPRPQEG